MKYVSSFSKVSFFFDAMLKNRGSMTNKKESYEVALQSLSEYNQCWWVRSDGCGVVCSWITILLHIFALHTQFRYVLAPWQGTYFSSWSLVYIFLCTMACISHGQCQFTQPGIVPKNLSAPSELLELNTKKYGNKQRPCRHCQIIKPKEAHHCSTCKRCIIRMDHHCPWINNCVGALNQKYFLLFLFYTCLCSLFCLGTLGHHFINCAGGGGRRRHAVKRSIPDWCENEDYNGVAATVSMAMNFAEGILFALFTFIMGCDQVSHIVSGTSTIDKMQGKLENRKGCLQSLGIVFGQPFSIMWFLPTRVTNKLIKDFESACLSFSGEDV